MCTEIVSDIQNNFCTQHVLQKEELLTKIYLYSLRRGFSSALGLISGDAIQVFLQEGQLAQENAFLVAVENETNAKYYVGKFNILQINY